MITGGARSPPLEISVWTEAVASVRKEEDRESKLGLRKKPGWLGEIVIQTCSEPLSHRCFLVHIAFVPDCYDSASELSPQSPSKFPDLNI